MLNLRGENGFTSSSSTDGGGYWSSSYGSYNNTSSDNSPNATWSSSCSPENSWTTAVSPQMHMLSSTSPTNNNFSLIDSFIEKSKEESAKGIKADYSKCKWLRSEGKRGRPKEYPEGDNIWRNNWVYKQKKEMDSQIKEAHDALILHTNEELKDEFFHLSLEHFALMENLCPHNRKTFQMAETNPKIQLNICTCSGNNQSGRF